MLYCCFVFFWFLLSLVCCRRHRRLQQISIFLKFLDGDTSSIDGDLRMSTTLRWESGDRKAKLNVRKEVIKEWVLLRDAKYNSVILI